MSRRFTHLLPCSKANCDSQTIGFSTVNHLGLAVPGGIEPGYGKGWTVKNGDHLCQNCSNPIVIPKDAIKCWCDVESGYQCRACEITAA